MSETYHLSDVVPERVWTLANHSSAYDPYPDYYVCLDKPSRWAATDKSFYFETASALIDDTINVLRSMQFLRVVL